MDAAIAMVREDGPTAVNVREAARRAGVSSGAPFRHFPDKTALMQAAAEQLAGEFVASLRAAAEAAGQLPMLQFRAMGIEYVRYAVANPDYFRLIHTPECASIRNSERMAELSEENNAAMRALLQQLPGMEAGAREIETTMLAARALVYGLARMFVDGVDQFERRDPEYAVKVATAVSDVFGAALLSQWSAPARQSATKPSPVARVRSTKPKRPARRSGGKR